MLEKIGEMLGNLSTFCLVVSLLIIVVKRKQAPLFIRYLGYYLLWNFVIEVGAYFMMTNQMNNLPLLHVYTLGELLLWSLFYREVLHLSAQNSKRFIAFVALAAVLVVLNSIFLQEIYGFNSYAKTLVNVIMIAYSTVYLSILLKTDSVEETHIASLGLVNSAVLIYYSGSLLVFMFSDYFLKNSEGLHVGFWIFNGTLNLIFQILILVAIWKALVKKNFFSLLR